MKVLSKTLILVIISALGSLLACSSEMLLDDVSEDSRFRPIIGTQYEVVSAIQGYGIRKHSKARVDYITLIPPPGIAGSEVGFRLLVTPGTKITVIKVFKTNRWIDPDILLIVRLDGIQMPSNVDTRIELFRGNEGRGFLQLNPNFYRRLN